MRLRPIASTRAFSLIELLTVMGIAVVLSTMAVSVMKPNPSTHLTAGVQKAISFFTMARTEAAVRRLPVRVAIATDWSSNPKGEYRAVSLWRAKQDDVGNYQQITNWEMLPEGIVFAPEDPSVPASDYGSKKITYMFDGSLDNSESLSTADAPNKMAFIEFLPNGTVRTPSSEIGDDFAVRVVEGSSDASGTRVRGGDNPNNYADIVTDSLVGRVKAYRP
jgi:prepilin-type N-terminal cleavage/methylation domain-containing protein